MLACLTASHWHVILKLLSRHVMLSERLAKTSAGELYRVIIGEAVRQIACGGEMREHIGNETMAMGEELQTKELLLIFALGFGDFWVSCIWAHDCQTACVLSMCKEFICLLDQQSFPERERSS